MNISRLVNGMTLMLLVFCLIFAAIIYIETKNMGNGFVQSTDQVKNPNHEAGILSGITQSTIAISQYSAILSRPLFVEGRMPFTEQEEEKSIVPTLSPLKLTLEGVVLSPETRVAVVRDLTNNNILRLGIGMAHNGWKVQKVDTQSVEFVRGGETQMIEIELSKAPAKADKTNASRLRSPVNQRAQRNVPAR